MNEEAPYQVLTLRLDPELHARFKAHCVKKRYSMVAVISELIQAHLQAVDKKNK